MDAFRIYPATRAQYAPQPGLLNISMDYNASPGGSARGTEVVIPDNASPEVRAAAERYNRNVAAFAARHGISDYPVRGIRTRSENKRGVPHTVHTEPFFNSDRAMQEAVKANAEEFAAIYKDAFGGLSNARLIAPHGVGNDRGAASPVFGSETDFGLMLANAALGSDYRLPDTPAMVAGDTMSALGITSPSGSPGQSKQEQSMNLLNLSTRDTAPVLEKQPWWNDDRRARLQMALEGMTLNPNQGVMYAAQQGLQERADTRKENRVEQKQSKRAERTIAALQAMGAPAELIALAEQDPVGAFGLAWEHKNRQPKSVTPYSAAGKLASDYRSGLISEQQYRSGITALETQGGGSAAEETIGRIMEVKNPQTGQPFSRQEAIQIADLYTVSRHPQTGEAQLINKATGRPVGAAEQPDTSDGVTVPTLQPKSPQNVGDVPSALGAQGIGKTFVNRVGDFFGAGLAFPEAEEARSELNNLSTQTMLTLSGEWSGRPSNLTRERIEALTVKPNEFFTGKDSALIKLQDMRDLIGEAMISADRVERGQFSPTQKTEARQKQRALDQLYRAYSAIISNLEGGSGSGTTSGGIKWSIEQ